MIRRLIAACVLALAVAAAPAAQTEEVVHTFELRDGRVYLDGRHLPDAVPDGLDLKGFEMEGPLEYSGPLVPVLEIDGEAYVLEGERLVLLAESNRPGRGVYIMGDVAQTGAAPGGTPEEVSPIVEAAYMRDVASQNEALYDRMQEAAAMQNESGALATRIRALPSGPERTRLRGQLRTLLSDLLSLHHEIREGEITIAAQRLDAARQELADRRALHDDIVDGRLQELLGVE
jgi:hypothetical protein